MNKLYFYKKILSLSSNQFILIQIKGKKNNSCLKGFWNCLKYIFSILHHKLVTKYVWACFVKGKKWKENYIKCSFFCKAMPHTPLLVATSVNSAMKICLACSLCDMKNPMRPKNCFTTDYFDNFFLNKGFQFGKKPDSNVSFCIEWRFFFQFLYQCMQGFFYVLQDLF